MFSTSITIFIFLVLATGLWLMIYGLFTRRAVAAIASVIVLLSLSFLFQSAMDIHMGFSKAIFQMSESGEVPLNISPLRIPEGMKEEESSKYCREFADENGDPINSRIYTQHGSYCGSIPDMDRPFVRIPFKIRPDGKAEYWTGTGYRTIGEAPKDWVPTNSRFFYQ